MSTPTQPHPAGQAEHTPTPWIIDDRDSASSVRIGSSVDRQATGLVGRIYGNTPGAARDNAAFIVRACNSHAALVAALEDAKAMLDKLGNFEGMQQVGKTSRYARIVAALAAAKDGQP